MKFRQHMSFGLDFSDAIEYIKKENIESAVIMSTDKDTLIIRKFTPLMLALDGINKKY